MFKGNMYFKVQHLKEQTQKEAIANRNKARRKGRKARSRMARSCTARFEVQRSAAPALFLLDEAFGLPGHWKLFGRPKIDSKIRRCYFWTFQSVLLFSVCFFESRPLDLSFFILFVLCGKLASWLWDRGLAASESLPHAMILWKCHAGTAA